MRVLIVDDEPLARRRLKWLLEQIGEPAPCGEAASCSEAIALTTVLDPDVVLLDVRMRDGNAFDYLNRAPDGRTPIIILVTAFDSHAVDAFQNEVLDFLVKPVAADRLRAALDRAQGALRKRALQAKVESLELALADIRDRVADDESPDYQAEFWIRRNLTGFVRVAADDIDWISAEEDYVRLVCGAHSHLLRSTLADLEKRLDPAKFVRIHRSTIVQGDRIIEFRRSAKGFEARLVNGTALRVGRVYAKRVKRDLGALERARHETRSRREDSI